MQGKSPAERYEELKNDPHYLRLRGEIAELRLAKEQYLAAHPQLGDPETDRHLMNLNERIRKLVDTAQRIDYAEEHLVTGEELMMLFNLQVDILRQEIPDAELRARIIGRFDAILHYRVRHRELPSEPPPLAALPAAGEVA
jgi:hypothetical protein